MNTNAYRAMSVLSFFSGVLVIVTGSYRFGWWVPVLTVVGYISARSIAEPAMLITGWFLAPMWAMVLFGITFTIPLLVGYWQGRQIRNSSLMDDPIDLTAIRPFKTTGTSDREKER